MKDKKESHDRAEKLNVEGGRGRTEGRIDLLETEGKKNQLKF